MGQGSVRRFAAKFESVGAIPTSNLLWDFDKRPFPSTEPPVYEIRDPGVISFFGRDKRDLANLSQVWQEVAMYARDGLSLCVCK